MRPFPLLLLLLALLLSACGRPIDRPRDGAPVDSEARGALEDSGPPTIVPPTRPTARVVTREALRLATPTVAATPDARPPAIRRLDPLPDAQVFAGNVRFRVQVTSSAADLAEVQAVLNGGDVQEVVGRKNNRSWAVSFISNLAPGTYEVQVEASDREGKSSTLAWQFEVVPVVGEVATPIEAPPTEPQGTPVPQDPAATPAEPAPDASPAPGDGQGPPVEATPVPGQEPPPAQPTLAPADPPAGGEPTVPPRRKAKPTATAAAPAV